ncbi:hypothetical protein F8388_023992 [Cannabis sativa]|uniref:Uncharacterized protein n=1 Tax=Cannabis sativa TaxID=3483 RepID=A0A7J6EWT7_CANSA|nr:hypothetical protein F8388_023992 [Cannabis sativa]
MVFEMYKEKKVEEERKVVLIHHLGNSRREENCPQLLDLIPQNREWFMNKEKEKRSHGTSDEEKVRA